MRRNKNCCITDEWSIIQQFFLLFHLSSKKSGGSLGQELFTGAKDVFFSFSHENDAADGVSGCNNRLDHLGTGRSRLLVHYRYFPRSRTQTLGFPVVYDTFQLAADHFADVFFASRACSSNT